MVQLLSGAWQWSTDIYYDYILVSFTLLVYTSVAYGWNVLASQVLYKRSDDRVCASIVCDKEDDKGYRVF